MILEVDLGYLKAGFTRRGGGTFTERHCASNLENIPPAYCIKITQSYCTKYCTRPGRIVQKNAV